MGGVTRPMQKRRPSCVLDEAHGNGQRHALPTGSWAGRGQRWSMRRMASAVQAWQADNPGHGSAQTPFTLWPPTHGRNPQPSGPPCVSCDSILTASPKSATLATAPRPSLPSLLSSTLRTLRSEWITWEGGAVQAASDQLATAVH